MSEKQQIPGPFAYLRSTSSKAILLVLISLILVVLGVAISQFFAENWWEGAFADYLDPIIAIGTFLVAGLVWLSARIEIWRSTWPKKLNIIYLIKEQGKWKTHISVLDAPLSSEADIRSWGQSIGQTIVPGSSGRISFTGFKIVPGSLDHKNRINYFGLLVFLKAPIAGATDEDICIFDAHGSMVYDLKTIPETHKGFELKDHIPVLNKPNNSNP